MRWKWRSGQEPDGPAFEQNPSEPPKIKFGENTLFGVCSEAKSPNVAEDDISVITHYLPGLGQYELFVQVVEYTNALEHQRGQSSIHALCELPQV